MPNIKFTVERNDIFIHKLIKALYTELLWHNIIKQALEAYDNREPKRPWSCAIGMRCRNAWLATWKTDEPLVSCIFVNYWWINSWFPSKGSDKSVYIEVYTYHVNDKCYNIKTQNMFVLYGACSALIHCHWWWSQNKQSTTANVPFYRRIFWTIISEVVDFIRNIFSI